MWLSSDVHRSPGHILLYPGLLDASVDLDTPRQQSAAVAFIEREQQEPAGWQRCAMLHLRAALEDMYRGESVCILHCLSP
jgi:hypothetical protein